MASVIVVAVLAVSCGGPSSGVPGTSTSTVAPSSSEPTTSTVPETTPSSGVTTTRPSVTATVPETATTSTLPGEPFEIGPRAGDVLGVVGVAHDDVLNVRAAPGTDQPIVARLDPLADDVVALGNARRLTRSIWFEVEVGGITGWASSRHLAHLGVVDDLTSQVVARLGGEIPATETMLEMGAVVAESLLPDAEGSRIVMVVAPTVGDLGEVTYDVIGLADDAQLGYRLHVFGAPTEGGEGFSLASVEATSLCGRGVTDDGLCV